MHCASEYSHCIPHLAPFPHGFGSHRSSTGGMMHGGSFTRQLVSTSVDIGSLKFVVTQHSGDELQSLSATHSSQLAGQHTYFSQNNICSLIVPFGQKEKSASPYRAHGTKPLVQDIMSLLRQHSLEEKKSSMHVVSMQVSQDESQQYFPLASSMPLLGHSLADSDVGSSVVSSEVHLHGRLFPSQDSVILLVQHDEAPPGLASHPLPPQLPQLEGQQYSPVESKIPFDGQLFESLLVDMTQGKVEPSQDAVI
mmetsp:Transcript_173/g.269  ORF Transcript_173/g.269 Transcript_173/m.269 type:complete len:252 (+) Transcript_173:407-1162(+)